MKRHSNPDVSAYSKRFAPWELETYMVFRNKKLAQKFEIYLKTQSGRAFLRRRLLK